MVAAATWGDDDGSALPPTAPPWAHRTPDAVAVVPAAGTALKASITRRGDATQRRRGVRSTGAARRRPPGGARGPNSCARGVSAETARRLCLS